MPDNLADEFLKRLANDMDHGHEWFINEGATRVSALYMDCDFQDGRPPQSSPEFGNFIKTVTKTDLRQERKEFDARVAAVKKAERERRGGVGGAATAAGKEGAGEGGAVGGNEIAGGKATTTPKTATKATTTTIKAELGASKVSSSSSSSATSATRSSALPLSDKPSLLLLPPQFVKQDSKVSKKSDEKKEDANDADDADDDESREKDQKSLQPGANTLPSFDVVYEDVGARLSRAFLDKFVNALQRVVFEYFATSLKSRDDPRLTCIVLTTPKDKYDVEVHFSKKARSKTILIKKRKCGMHIVWPWLYATQNDMLDLREGWLRAVGQACGDRLPTSNTWDEVIDKNIYREKASALRMVNCDKVETCKRCKKSPALRYDCPECHGAPPASGRVYRPEFSFDGNGRLTTHATECLKDTYHMLKLCRSCFLYYFR